MKKLIPLFLSALIVSMQPCLSQVTYVTVSGAGLKNGSSWSNAMNATMLKSIIRYYPATPNAQIWVAAGTYRPDSVSRDSTFNIAQGVKLYGGFAGNETQLSQRNWNANATILSGDVGTPNVASDNSYNVVTFEVADSALLDGFTITGGHADALSTYLKQVGGGVLNLSSGYTVSTSAPEVRNCRFTGNYASESGGAIANISYVGTAHCIVSNCHFEDNAAVKQGGAIFSIGWPTTLQQVPPGNASLTIRNSTFLHDTIPGGNTFGGAIAVVNGGGADTEIITGCHFENNYAGTGGAVCMSTYAALVSNTGTSELFIDSSTFLHNSSDAVGTAISSMMPVLLSVHTTIRNTTFIRNHGLSAGGCVAGFYPSGTTDARERFIGCRFLDNNRDNASTTITANGADSLLVSNSFFYNNCQGTDIYAEASDGARRVTIVSNSTLYHDSTTTQSATGIENRALYYSGYYPNTDAALYVYNSILWHKVPSWGVNWQFEIENYTSGTGIPPTTAHSYVANSILTGSAGTWPADYGTNGGGNSGLYPRFRDTANMDFHLLCNSFGIDHGNNAHLYPATLAKDVNGDARIYNNTVDIGALETSVTALPQVIPSGTVTGNILTYNNSLAGVTDSVHWDFGDGDTSMHDAGTHTYQHPGTYTVCLYVHSSCGSSDSCFSITIQGTGIENTAGNNNGLVLYPNPVKDAVTIAGMHAAGALYVYNTIGQLVYTTLLHAGDNRVQLASLIPGTYILEVKPQSGTISRSRIVKE